MIEILTIIDTLVLAGLAIYLYRFQHPVYRHEYVTEQKPDIQEFMCYFCHYWFPLEKLERIGKYDYCLEHGTKRKERLLKEDVGVSQPQSARHS